MVSRDNPGDSAERDIFLREICESPDTLLHSAEVLAAQADALAGIRSTLEGRRVTLTGMGSSADAVTGLASILGRRGMDCPNIHTAELLHYRMDALGPGAAVVAVSQSGLSIEAVKMTAKLRQKGGIPLVAVTNAPDSPLAEAADVSLDIAAGDEQGPSSKTYVATMLLMHVLAEVIGTDKPIDTVVEQSRGHAEQAAGALREWLKDAEGLGQALADWIEPADALMVLGRGVSVAPAELNGLVLKESAHVPAQSMDSAEFRHGPLELAGPGLNAVLMCLEPVQASLDARLRQDLIARGASVKAIGVEAAETPGLPLDYSLPGTAPLIDAGCAALPLLLAAWAEASRRSETPGVFHVGAKVTTCE